MKTARILAVAAALLFSVGSILAAAPASAKLAGNGWNNGWSNGWQNGWRTNGANSGQSQDRSPSSLGQSPRRTVGCD